MKKKLTTLIVSLLLAAMQFPIYGRSNYKTEENNSPNIIVILVDDLGYGDLSVNGGHDIKTPNIDRLFEQGMQFKNFYANCTVCSPTRASLLTGCYPDIVGVPGVIRSEEDNTWGYFREDVLTLPDVLKTRGYNTALIGKWHLGLESPNLPNKRGFDFFHGFLGDMMDDYWTHLRGGINYMRRNDEVINPKGHATNIFSDWAVDYLKEQNENDSPFFLYLAYNAPHFPIQPPEEWYKKVKAREPGITDKRAKNVAFVEHLDFGIGKVLNALEELELDDNTLVIFSSDNGGHLESGASNGDLRGGKQDMYEGGIKVPTCFVWKNEIRAGTNSNEISVMMDLFPTICDIAGLDINENIDGVSLYSVLKGETSNPEIDNRTIYFMRREGGKYSGMSYYAARRNSFKIVQNSPFEPIQLFNIEEDPLEKNPINDNDKVYEEMRYELSQHIKKAGRIPWQK